MNPFDHEEAFNVIVVGGRKSPGVVKLSGHGLSVKWDVKAGGAQDGASTTRKGKQPAAFTATFQLTKDPTQDLDEFAEWDAFVPTLRATFEPKAPQALEIYHPDLAELGIKSVVVKKIGGKVHDGRGGAIVAVEFLEYAPPKPKPARKPSGGKTSPEGERPDPNAARKAELAALLAEARKPSVSVLQKGLVP